MLEASAEEALREARETLEAVFGRQLLCLALYGSAAGPEYVPGVSDINLVLVLDRPDTSALDELRARVAPWRKRRIATPLVVDRDFLRDAADVFPMELYDIKEQRRILSGTDLFADLPIHDDQLRFECEHEARGKMLRLRQLYLEIGDDRRRLQSLILDSLKTFLIVMRNLNRLRGLRGLVTYESVLRAFGREFGCDLPEMARLLDVRLGRGKWAGDERAVFRAYVEELQHVIRAVDRLKCEPRI